MGISQSSRSPRTVSATLFSGSLSTPSDFLGISAWYVPWDAERAASMLAPELYSINRYCTVYGTPNNNTQWATCNPASGTFAWADMDAWVDYHYGRGTDVLAQVGGWCPTWASARPAEQHASFAGCPTEPANMADFVAWLVAVGTRYNGKIKYWLMPNEPNFSPGSEFTGTKEKYAEMCRLASQVLKAINPANKICGPEPSSIGDAKWASVTGPVLQASAQGYNAGYGDGAGTFCKDWIDIITVHPYVNGYNHRDSPYGNVNNWPRLFSDLASIGVVGKEVWASEIMMIPPDNINDQNEFAFIIRDAVMAAINGVSRYIWFGYGGAGRPWYSPDEARSNNAHRCWNQMREILFGSPIVLVQKMSDSCMRIEKADGKVYFV